MHGYMNVIFNKFGYFTSANMKAYINVTQVKVDWYANCGKFMLEGLFWADYSIILKTFYHHRE
jgi:hypothetical protein